MPRHVPRSPAARRPSCATTPITRRCDGSSIGARTVAGGRMGKKASPFTIGAFVVAAVALAVVGVIVFGSGRFFRRTEKCVIYFKRSVNGLRVGAPVKVKGVEIGAVNRILLRLGSLALQPEDVRIPVIIEIDRDRNGQAEQGRRTQHDGGGGHRARAARPARE